jgi:hypothetical protein
MQRHDLVLDGSRLASVSRSARAALARVLAPVMLHPLEKDGKRSYEARGALKIEDPVSLSGSRVLEMVGCGGGVHAPR